MQLSGLSRTSLLFFLLLSLCPLQSSCFFPLSDLCVLSFADVMPLEKKSYFALHALEEIAIELLTILSAVAGRPNNTVGMLFVRSHIAAVLLRV